MYRVALRAAPRIARPLGQSVAAASGRRFASTSSEAPKRGWKSSAARWAVAIGAIYYYSTGAVFAEEPRLNTIQPPPEFSEEDLPTVDAIVAQKRKEAAARQQAAAEQEVKIVAEPKAEIPVETPVAPSDSEKEVVEVEQDAAELEGEAAQQGAFNPETGEINWDCPCLGGMAHGPCGEEFKAAFSCFVYSKEEPKGMDCIDKFQHMQDCFRLHPEVYGEELADDDEAAKNGTEAEPVAAKELSAEPTESTSAPKAETEKTIEAKPEVDAVATSTKEAKPAPESPAK